MPTEWFDKPRLSSLGFIATNVTRLVGNPPALGVYLNRWLDPSHVAPTTAFTLENAGDITVRKITIERCLVLELSAELPPGSKAHLSYDPPEPVRNGPRVFHEAIRDIDGVLLFGFRLPIE